MNVKRCIPIDELLPIGHDVNLHYYVCHTHKYYEFLLIIRGSAYNMINDEIQMLKRNSLTAIRPEDAHYIKKDDNNKDVFEFFNIPVPVEYMNKQYNECAELKDRIESNKVPSNVQLSNTETGVLVTKALKLSTMQDSEKRKYLYYCLVNELCSCMLNYDETNFLSRPQWFSELIKEIDKLDMCELNYNQILKMSKISKSGLWKAFKKFYGMTPSQYINKKKMLIAYQMVIGSEETFTNIAYQLEYGTYEHFYREFVKYYHISPKGLRNVK